MNKVFPAAAAATTGVLVGAAIVATRFVLDQTSPAALALLRYLIGFCCLVLPLLYEPRRPFASRDLVPISLLGVAQFGVAVGLLNYALQFIPSSRAALVFATSPLLTMGFSIVFGHEHLSAAKVVGVLLTIVGVGLALGEGALQSISSSWAWHGEAAVLASACCVALCSVLYRPYVQRYSPLQVSAVAMLASVLFLAVPAAGEGLFDAFPRFTLNGWVAVGFIGASSGVGYYLWLWALRHTTPTNVTVFLALSPVTATALGAVFLGETIAPAFVIGLVCVAVGVWLTQRRAS